jgi:hypothetical protein
MPRCMQRGPPTQRLTIKRREGSRKAALPEAQQIDDSTKSVKITSELEAVKKTLTENELAVLRALLSHGGCMTQVDLRYDTDLANPHYRAFCSLLNGAK